MSTHMPFAAQPPWLTLAAPAQGALRLLGMGLWLWAVGCGVAAQPSTSFALAPALRQLEPQDDARVSRSAGLTAPAAIEVATLDSRLLARTVPVARPDEPAGTELMSNPYRAWRPYGGGDAGDGIGTPGYRAASADRRAPIRNEVQPRPINAVPAAPLGLRLRMSIEHTALTDAQRARGLGVGPPLAYVGTKIGVEWKPATSTLGLAHGALGMQLESGYKVSVKVRHGGPSLYLRGSF